MQGFQIEKTYENIIENWKEIEEGNISWRDPRRAGQCHKPLNRNDMRYISILHQKLRSLDHCLKLLYHLASSHTNVWKDPVSGTLKQSKQDVIEHIWNECHFAVDTPTSAGGNTNTGGNAELFFSERNRSKICSIIPDESSRQNFEKMLSYFNIMLSITQHCDTSRIVDWEKLQHLGIEMMLFHRSVFAFAAITPTIHQMCGHSHQLFQMNNGKPIAIYSEQAGEAWNKSIRSFQSGAAARARQNSLQNNLKDIFSRRMITTHPTVTAKRITLFCRACSCYGHTVKSCSKRYSTVLSEEETSVQSYFI